MSWSIYTECVDDIKFDWESYDSWNILRARWIAFHIEHTIHEHLHVHARHMSIVEVLACTIWFETWFLERKYFGWPLLVYRGMRGVIIWYFGVPRVLLLGGSQGLTEGVPLVVTRGWTTWLCPYWLRQWEDFWRITWEDRGWTSGDPRRWPLD